NGPLGQALQRGFRLLSEQACRLSLANTLQRLTGVWRVDVLQHLDGAKDSHGRWGRHVSGNDLQEVFNAVANLQRGLLRKSLPQGWFRQRAEVLQLGRGLLSNSIAIAVQIAQQLAQAF